MAAAPKRKRKPKPVWSKYEITYSDHAGKVIRNETKATDLAVVDHSEGSMMFFSDPSRIVFAVPVGAIISVRMIQEVSQIVIPVDLSKSIK